MIVFYYEVGFLDKPKKYVRYNINRTFFDLQYDFLGPLKLVYQSHRIWEFEPDSGSVRFRKNRKGEGIPVDLKEFCLVQLRAENWSSFKNRVI